MKILAIDGSTKEYVVYLLTFPNGKKYCGYSSNIKRRWRSKYEYKNQRLVYNAINKYGWENIKKEILFKYDNAKEALEKEKEYIEENNLLDYNFGYNLVPGGGDPPHGLQYVSEEGYKKMQENGKRLATEIWSDPEKAAYCVQRMREETHKKRMLMSKEELKEKYGKHNIGRITVNAKPIYQLDRNTKEIINEFPSARAAAIAVTGEAQSSKNISRTANGKGKTAYGYSWRWKNENIVD